MENKKLRNTNIEILRIVLMLMVIGVHYNLIGMGNAYLYTQNAGVNISLTNLLESLCIVCVDTFVIISGYFQIKKETIDYKKIIKYIIVILFFNLVQYVISVLLHNDSFSFGTLIRQLLSGKWFIIIYLVLYLFSPYINRLIRALNINEYKKLLTISVLIFIVYQTILSYMSIFIPVVGWSGIIDQGIDKGYTLLNFIVLYLIGGYIRLQDIKPKIRHSVITYLVSTSIIFLSWYLLYHFDHGDSSRIPFYYNNIFVVLSSAALFLIFNKISIKNNRYINYVSKHMMIIFIVSTSPLLINLYSIMNVEKYSVTKLLVPHFVITCTVIFLISLVIGIIGDFVLEKTIFKIIDKSSILEAFDMFKFRKKVKVYFIAQYKAGLDKFASVVDEMKSDKKLNVKVLVFPENINNVQSNDDFAFWKKRFGNIAIDALLENNKWFDLKKKSPDYVFIQRPYDHYLPCEYSTDELKKYTKLCYIPYGYSLADLHDVILPKSFLEKLYFFFGENDEECKYAENMVQDKVKIKSLGYPSLNKEIRSISLNDSKSLGRKKKELKVIWTPRWTTEKSLFTTTFFTNRDSIVRYFKKNEELNLIFRPHPLMFKNFIEKKLMTKKEVKNYLASFNQKNMIYDQQSEYLETFKDSDILITDFSSIIIEYFVLGKPIILCDKDSHRYSGIMKKIDKVCYHAVEWNEIEKIIKQIKEGKDKLKNKRDELLKQIIDCNKEDSAKLITECIKQDFYK